MGRPQRCCTASHRSAGAVLVAAHLSRWPANRCRHRCRVLEGLGARCRARNVHPGQPTPRRSGSRRVDARQGSRDVRCRYDRKWRGPPFLGQVRGAGNDTFSWTALSLLHLLGWSPDGRKLLFRKSARQPVRTCGSIPQMIERRCRSSKRRPTSVVGCVLAGRPLGRVRVRRIGSGRGVRAAVSGARHADSGFGRWWHGAGVVARRPRALLRESGHLVHGARQPRPNIHERHGPTSVLRTVHFRRGHRELRRGS